jgi:hypothetical protein
MTLTRYLPGREAILCSSISHKKPRGTAKANEEVGKTSTIPKLMQKTMRRQRTSVVAPTTLAPRKKMINSE